MAIQARTTTSNMYHTPLGISSAPNNVTGTLSIPPQTAPTYRSTGLNDTRRSYWVSFRFLQRTIPRINSRIRNTSCMMGTAENRTNFTVSGMSLLLFPSCIKALAQKKEDISYEVSYHNLNIFSNLSTIITSIGFCTPKSVTSRQNRRDRRSHTCFISF